MTATFELPRLRPMAVHALPRLIEATAIPLALFYGAMWLIGMTAALASALAWAYACIIVRWVRRTPVPGVTVLAALTLTVRTVVGLASGSVFIYFLQPTLGTIAVAGAFLLSVPVRRPLAAKLAADFCPLPSELTEHLKCRRFFERISLLWAFVYLTNAALTIWLLVSQTVATYLWTKTVVSLGLTVGAIIVSTLWFKQVTRRHSAAGRLFGRSRSGAAAADAGDEPALAHAA